MANVLVFVSIAQSLVCKSFATQVRLARADEGQPQRDDDSAPGDIDMFNPIIKLAHLGAASQDANEDSAIAAEQVAGVARTQQLLAADNLLDEEADRTTDIVQEGLAEVPPVVAAAVGAYASVGPAFQGAQASRELAFRGNAVAMVGAANAAAAKSRAAQLEEIALAAEERAQAAEKTAAEDRARADKAVAAAKALAEDGENKGRLNLATPLTDKLDEIVSSALPDVVKDAPCDDKDEKVQAVLQAVEGLSKDDSLVDGARTNSNQDVVNSFEFAKGDLKDRLQTARQGEDKEPEDFTKANSERTVAERLADIEPEKYEYTMQVKVANGEPS